MKRLFTLFLFAILFGGYAFSYDFSAVCSSGQTLYYNITSSTEPYTVEVTSQNTSLPYYPSRRPNGSLTIPSSITNNDTIYSITSIGNYAFHNCNGLTSVSIPSSVTSIGNCAFYGCNALTGLAIANSVTNIGEEAFYQCSALTSITIPNSVINIGVGAFNRCSGLTRIDYTGTIAQWCEINFLILISTANNNTSSNPLYYAHNLYINNSLVTDLIVPNTVTKIKDNVFYSATCLTSVTIPNSVDSIGKYAFYGCTGLTSITIPNSVTSIDNYAFSGCSNLATVNFNATNCTTMGNPVFSYCNSLATLNIGENVTNIPNNAFYNCSGLTSVTIPNSVTSIGVSAFFGCNGLTSLTIGNGVTSIGGGAFYNCSGLTEVSIPNSVTSIGRGAFYGCSGLVDMTIPFVGGSASATESSESTLFGYIFNYSASIITGTTQQYYASYGSINAYIPSSLRSVTVTGGNLLYGAFYGCSMLTSVTIPSSVTSIGNYVFYNCSGLTSATIHNSVTSIGNSAFCNCSGLTEVTIPNSVTNIGDYAFYSCSGLSSVTIPNSVTSIGNYAFQNCSGLTTVNFNATNCTSMGSSSSPAFSGCTALQTLNIGENVTNIPACAFYNCNRLSSITIPSAVTNIGNSAFQNCTGITSINYNATNCTSMGSSSSPAFSGCTALQTINIGNNVTNIPAYAFYNCNRLSSITIPNAVTSIGNSAFQNCTGITSVNYNATNCTSMGSSSSPAFSGCTALQTINIGNNVTNIPAYAFKGCSGFSSITIPTNVQGIGEYAFQGCTGLEAISIPSSVTSIGASALGGCSGLTSVTIPYIGNRADVTATDTYRYPLGYLFGTSSYSGGSSVSQSYYGSSASSTTSSTYYIPSSLRSVTVLDGYIPYGAFQNCSMLTSITIPTSITAIEGNTFYGCSGLSSITIPNTVTSIGANAFYNCSNIANVSLPSAVTNIGASAFYNCNHITSITIPNAVTSIGNSAFQNCTGITSVNFNATNCTSMGSSSYPVFGSCNANATISIGANVTKIPEYAFNGLRGSGTLNIPETVTSIGNYAFSGCNGITAANLPDALQNIPVGLFYECSGLRSVNIPTSASSIGNYAFYGCNNLNGNIAIPNSVTIIGANAFYNCNAISSLSIGSSVSSIGSNAFYNCSGLTSITVDASNTTYDSRDNCNAIITKSNNSLLLGCNSTIIPETVRSIGTSAFYNCRSLRRVNIPQQLTSLGNDAFAGCSAISEVVVNATSLNSNYTQSPFSAAQTSLKKISLGEGVTRLPNYMFAGCTALDTIIANPTVPPTIYSSTFDYNHVSSTRVIVPCRTADIYSDADFWYNFRRIKQNEPCPTIYTVTALSNNNLFGTVTGGGEYEENSTVTLSATANYGYRFVAWNDGNEENPRTISVTNDVTYIATFVEIPPVATYTITALSSNPTIGVVTGGGSYYEGTEVTLTANPNEGYAFVSWNDGETLNPRQITVSGDAMYIASFIVASVVTNYEVSVASSNLAYGTVSGSGTYSLGNVVTISATAFDGYMFTSWNDGNTDNPRSITVIGDAMYVANFAVIPPTPIYTLTVLSINNAYGAVSGGGEYEENAVATLTATPNEGYEFTSWSDGSTDNPHEVTVTRNAMYVAYFDELPQTPTYNITVIASNPNHGSVTGSGVYEANAEVTLTATAFEGYRFDVWSDGSTENPRSITVTSDAMYVANFVEIPETPVYTLTVLSINNAYGAVSGGGDYEENAVATLTATPNDGYEFTSWSDGSTDNPHEVTVTRNAMYVAYFDELPQTPTYNITVIASNPNHGSVTGGGVYEENTEITLTATAFDGYRFDIWSDGNTDSIRTVTVTSDAIYIANFVHIDEAETIYVTVIDTACGSYTWNGVTYTESGTYYRTFTATNSADSIVALGLVILPLPEPVITVDGILDACNQETASVTLSAGNYSSYNWTTGENSSSIVVTTPGYYFVEVVDSMGCHGNSEEVIIGYSTVLTEAPRIRNLGMNNNGYISLNWTVAQTEGVAGYEVYREDNETNVFRLVKRINNARTKLLIDSTADPSARAYRYKVCAIDSCGGMSPMSEPHKTMHLTINKGIDNTWNLIWSHYEGFELRGYKIIRGTTMANMAEIDVVPSNQNSYTDYSNPYNLGFFYKIMIIKNTRSNEEEEEMLSSNIVDNGYIVMHTVMAAASNPLCGNVTGSGAYPDGTEIVVEATANEGYEFMSWNDGSTQNPRNAIITSDTLFIANFVEIPQVASYNIMVYSSNPAYGTVTGSGTYAEGTEITIAATASSGYEFVSWSDGNRENPRTLIVTEDAMYIATFVEASSIANYTITVISANPTQGIVTGGGTYPEGTVISIEAIANDGYEFISWNDNNFDNPREITVTADAMYIATFVPATGIAENVVPEISVYPNPVTDIINIASSVEIAEFEIVNVMGQVVLHNEVNSENAVCDVAGLPSGVYMVRVRLLVPSTDEVPGADIVQMKFVKE